MTEKDLPAWFLDRIKWVTGKRPRTVIDHILKHGYITTEELKTKYGYDHPPRAARDVRENGIPLETFRVKNSEGRSIGAYKFADTAKAAFDKIGGRKVFSKEFKQQLIKLLGCKCTISLEPYEERYLQVDHRIPYEVSGETQGNERNIIDYMLLCGSCNRAKSWSCEHCINWIEDKNPEICKACYWASPESYKHVALRQIRRLDIVWTEQEIEVYDQLTKRANAHNIAIPQYVKNILKQHLKSKVKHGT